MFEVKIYTSNDTLESFKIFAFMDNYALVNELEKILRTIPAKITCGYKYGCLFDTNGNLVGEWRVE